MRAGESFGVGDAPIAPGVSEPSLAIPGQTYRVVGAELVALASILDAVAPNAVTSALLLVAGLLLVFDVHAGLDVLVLPVLVALAGGVTSAWLLLTKIPE